MLTGAAPFLFSLEQNISDTHPICSHHRCKEQRKTGVFRHRPQLNCYISFHRAMESTLYAKGSQLSLSVFEHGRDQAVPARQLTVTILELASAPTMSVVIKVSLRDDDSGLPRPAILKMYDRRVSPSLRRNYNPAYDDDAESAWGEYVRDGKAPALFAFLREKHRREEEEGQLVDTDSETDPGSSEDDDEGAGVGLGRGGRKKRPRTADEMREKKGKREGIMQWKALQLFECETRAYAKLSHLQGRCVPRLLTQVYLTVEKTPRDLGVDDNDDNPTHHRDYFEVRGVLMEYVDGFNLSDLNQTDVPEHKWHGIVQQAVDAAQCINDAGVINLDCQPRNVVVQREDLRPFHIDFAQCLFAEDIGWTEFEETRLRLGNQKAIGNVMVGKLKRAGVHLPVIRYDNGDRDCHDTEGGSSYRA